MRTFTIALCLLASAVSLAQPKSLQKATADLYNAFDTIDLDAILAKSCASGDQKAYSVLDNWFLNEEFKFRFVNTNAKYIYGPVKVIDGNSYSNVKFRNVIRITYFKPLTLQQISAKQQELKSLFKANTIIYDKVRNCYLITYSADMIAFLRSGEAEWKFAFSDETLPESISSNCIPESVKKELAQ